MQPLKVIHKFCCYCGEKFGTQYFYRDKYIKIRPFYHSTDDGMIPCCIFCFTDKIKTDKKLKEQKSEFLKSSVEIANKSKQEADKRLFAPKTPSASPQSKKIDARLVRKEARRIKNSLVQDLHAKRLKRIAVLKELTQLQFESKELLNKIVEFKIKNLASYEAINSYNI